MSPYDDVEQTGMGTHGAKESGMDERATLLDFPGADELMAAGQVGEPSAQALSGALARVGTAAAAEAAGRGTGDVAATPVRRLSARRRVLVGMFTAAAVAAGAVTYANAGAGSAAPTGTGTRGETRAAGAGVFLNDMSTVAASQSATTGKYWKTHTKAGDTYLSQSMDFYVMNDGKAYKKGRRPDWQFGPKNVDWKGLDQLTTDPAKLLQLLRTPAKTNDIAPFDQATALLGDTPASPKLRAGVFKAMAGLKGVRLVGAVKDSTGRGGTALEFQEARSLGRVTVDPKTSAILEYTFTWTSGPSKGKVTHDTILSMGFTDRIG
ncbi:hypothetical protein [Streptomyces laculatispora]|uniref:hypothetical protein n=1 Tax=Streptomyces laculatispora TaxID=887464 RepID=UPI001A948FE5|nr:hypothetical protein [Streptomyces laculatispora]MBO0915373.1 hypothetical protein [Streptomyces laculatispora]